MTETEAFIAGWKSRASRDIREIEELIEAWQENGPSKATARAIIKKLISIPNPHPEETK
jgi:hypothetical protein